VVVNGIERRRTEAGDITQMKKRISSIERAFDSIVSKDDARAIEEARRDLADGKTVSLSQFKKKHS
jgi:hypothetical protein